MGSKMAANLSSWLHANSYPPLVLWTRTASKLPAESDSIKHAASIKELAEKCDVVITSLANDEVAKEVFEQLFEGVKSKQEKGAKGNTYFVESSTLYPLTAGESDYHPPCPSHHCASAAALDYQIEPNWNRRADFALLIPNRRARASSLAHPSHLLPPSSRLRTSTRGKYSLPPSSSAMRLIRLFTG